MLKRKSIIVGIKSYNLTSEEKYLLKSEKPWGVILFSRNIKNIDQTKLLISKIKNIVDDPNYPILIDQEGGRVSRLNTIIDTSIFSAKHFGNLFKTDKYKFKVYFCSINLDPLQIPFKILPSENV